MGAGTEGSSWERRLDGGIVEAEGIIDARMEKRWVAPVVRLESTGVSW